MDTQAVQNHYNMEQGVSINEYIDIDVEGEVKTFQITVRNGMDVVQAVAQTEVAIQAYRELRKKYPRPNGSGQPKAESKPVERTENPDKPKRSYDEPIPQNELPLELSETTVGVFVQEFDWFVIEPKPDEKASVKFYKDGLEFPVGAYINNWKHDTVQNALAPLGDIDASKAEKHRVAGDQYWKKGAEYTNKKGLKSNYKDFLLVQGTL